MKQAIFFGVVVVLLLSTPVVADHGFWNEVKDFLGDFMGREEALVGQAGGGTVCGDGVKLISEQCDDGNRNNGDGCDSNCEIEILRGATCVHDTSLTHIGPDSICTFCGDGSCKLSETLTSCPRDCSVCGDNICGGFYEITSCPSDCGLIGKWDFENSLQATENNMPDFCVDIGYCDTTPTGVEFTTSEDAYPFNTYLDLSTISNKVIENQRSTFPLGLNEKEDFTLAGWFYFDGSTTENVILSQKSTSPIIVPETGEEIYGWMKLWLENGFVNLQFTDKGLDNWKLLNGVVISAQPWATGKNFIKAKPTNGDTIHNDCLSIAHNGDVYGLRKNPSGSFYFDTAACDYFWENGKLEIEGNTIEALSQLIVAGDDWYFDNEPPCGMAGVRHPTPPANSIVIWYKDTTERYCKHQDHRANSLPAPGWYHFSISVEDLYGRGDIFGNIHYSVWGSSVFSFEQDIQLPGMSRVDWEAQLEIGSSSSFGRLAQLQVYDNALSSDILPSLHEFCGNSFIDPGEECDDGNNINTDACTNICELPVCGDTWVGPGEICDDGNTVNSDGCEADCNAFSCSVNNGIAPIHLWSAEDNYLDSAGDNDARNEGAAGFADGLGGRAFTFNGIGRVEAGPVDLPGGGQAMSTSFFIKTQSGGQGIFSYQAEGSREFSVSDASNMRLSIREHNAITNIAVNDDRMHLVVVAWSNTAGLSIFVDGTQAYADTDFAEGVNLKSGGTLMLGNEFDINGNLLNKNFDGLLDEVTIWNSYMGASNIISLGDCIEHTCGDGYLCSRPDCTSGPSGGPEVCDDGDGTDAGTCNADCSVLTYCGDGIPQRPNGEGVSEACDDGNTDNGDGCSSSCELEDGVVCVPIPGRSTQVCILANPDEGQTPLEVTFSSFLTEVSDDLLLELTFDDGAPATSFFPSPGTHTYSYEGVGTYTAILKVFEGFVELVRVTTTITVLPRCGDDVCDAGEETSCPDDCLIDADGDLIADAEDNCVNTQNPEQVDTDDDGQGDVCDVDDDDDGIIDVEDNCPTIQNDGESYLRDTNLDGGMDSCSNPIVYYKFNEEFGNDIIDSFPPNYNGVIVGGVTRENECLEGKCIDLDGNNGRIDTVSNHFLQLGTQQTINVWFKLPSNPHKGWQRIVGKGANSQRNYGVWVTPGSNSILFDTHATDGLPGCWIPSNLDDLNEGTFDGEWHFLTGTYDGVHGKIYFDGELRETRPCTAMPPIDDNPLHIGFINSDSFAEFKGGVDEVTIYDRAMQRAEVMLQYDFDEDGHHNFEDNCPLIENQEQHDMDADGIGDICDDDIDGDGLLNRVGDISIQSNSCSGGETSSCTDNCPVIENKMQEDGNNDGQGDACEDDFDDDGILNLVGVNTIQDDSCKGGNVVECTDNCPLIINPLQLDGDNDGKGNNCDSPICGNNFKEGTEWCDDGDVTDAGICNAECSAFTTCGDGTVQNPNGLGFLGVDGDGSEECDPANTDNDAPDCSPQCTFVGVPFCGDGILQPLGADGSVGGRDDEICDDGNRGACTMCQTLECSAFNGNLEPDHFWTADSHVLDIVSNGDFDYVKNGAIQTHSTDFFVAGKKRAAFNFDGDDSLQKPVFIPGSHRTVSFWIKTNEPTGTILSHIVSGQDNAFVISHADSLKVTINDVELDTGVDVTGVVWKYVTVTWSFIDKTLRVYVDGSEEYSGSLDAGTLKTSGLLVLGYEKSSFDSTYNDGSLFMGHLDEVTIWGDVLSNEEVVTGFTCNPNTCNDGYFHAGVEECDDDSGGSELCSPLCTLTFCGDFKVQDPNGVADGGTTNIGDEACDQGPDGDNSCTTQCVVTSCGDNEVQSPNGDGDGGPNNDGHEDCDDGQNGDDSDGCLDDCSFSHCGDGEWDLDGVDDILGNGDDEQCDDGNTNNNDGCTNECLIDYDMDGTPNIDIFGNVVDECPYDITATNLENCFTCAEGTDFSYSNIEMVYKFDTGEGMPVSYAPLHGKVLTPNNLATNPGYLDYTRFRTKLDTTDDIGTVYFNWDKPAGTADNIRNIPVFTPRGPRSDGEPRYFRIPDGVRTITSIIDITPSNPNDAMEEICTQFCVGTEYDKDSDGYCPGYDCNDDPDNDGDKMYPGNTEVCDYIDNNCDGLIDEGFNKLFYLDADGDGYGDENFPESLCRADADGYVQRQDDLFDCNDDSVLGGLIYPGATETCNGKDNDCDGIVDSYLVGGVRTNACPVTYYYCDYDNDGEVSSISAGSCDTHECVIELGCVEAQGNDCDDLIEGDPDGVTCPTELTNCADDVDFSTCAICIYNGAAEVCDLVDNNCDGNTDESPLSQYFVDNDGDGFGSGDVFQICAAEVPVGYAVSGTDCDDSDNAIPADQEVPAGHSSLVWQNQQYYVDADGDGEGSSVQEQVCVGSNTPDGYSTVTGDCNDDPSKDIEVCVGSFSCSDPTFSQCAICINTDASEVCDNVDNNCDSQTDEGLEFLPYYPDNDGDTFGMKDTPADQVVNACIQPKGMALSQDDCDDIPPVAGVTCPSTPEECDGYSTCAICINPGATEVCDDVDNDCNDEVDEEGPEVVWNTYYNDVDGDGFGAGTRIESCLPVQGASINNLDCNDNFGVGATINPDAQEVCDGVDNDCDYKDLEDVNPEDNLNDNDEGGIDEDLYGVNLCPANTYFIDQDGDGVIGTNPHTCATADCLEALEVGYLLTAGQDCADLALEDDFNHCASADCNDVAFAECSICRYPDATEVCDNVDNNCNGAIDEGVTTPYYPDLDIDGFGDEGAIAQPYCVGMQPGNYITDNTDCNDDSNLANPNLPENDPANQCDGLDNDCDGDIDEDEVKTTYYLDNDGDNFGDANSPALFCLNSHSNGYVANSADCNDNNPDIWVEGVYYTDADDDGFGVGDLMTCPNPGNYANQDGDCDDTLSERNPGNTEQCDIIDHDCDGDPINGLPTDTYYYDQDGDNYGVDDVSVTTCLDLKPENHVVTSGDCNDANSNVNPAQNEICDAIDNDCDAEYVDDQGYIQTAESPINEDVCTQFQYFCDVDNDDYISDDPAGEIVTGCNVDSLAVGVEDGSIPDADCTCDQPAVESADCNDALPDFNPGVTEICDNFDKNCDGNVDFDLKITFYLDADEDEHGNPDVTTLACSAPTGYVGVGDDCNDADNEMNPSFTEVCDGKDNDCDYDSNDDVNNDFRNDNSDGGVDEDFTNTNNNNIGDQCEDNDEDGYTRADEDGVEYDCVDNDLLIYPGADEICYNEIDENCNGDEDDTDDSCPECITDDQCDGDSVCNDNICTIDFANRFLEALRTKVNALSEQPTIQQKVNFLAEVAILVRQYINGELT